MGRSAEDDRDGRGRGESVERAGTARVGERQRACERRRRIRAVDARGADRARACVARRSAGGDRAGCGDARGVRDGDLQGAGDVARRLDQEAIARRGRARYRDREAIDSLRHRAERLRVAVRQPGDRVVGPVVAQAIVRRLQRRRILDRCADRAAACVRRRVGDHRRRNGEEIAAQRTGEVHAQVMLRVHRRGERDGDAPERVLRRREVAITKREQPAERTAGQRLRGEAQHARAVLQSHFVILRIVGVGPRDERARRLTDDQALPVAQEHVHRAVALRDRRRADLVVQAADQLVALVEQIVRLLIPGRRRFGDPLVEVGDLLRVAVDRRHGALDLLVVAAADLGELIVLLPQARHQRLRRGQEGLARRRVGRMLRDGVERGEEIVHRRRQAGGRVAEEVVELAELGRVRVELRRTRRHVLRLRAEVIVVHAAHRRHLHARADVAAAAELRRGVGLHRLLARVARGVDVAEVVAGRRQAGLRRRETAQADAEDAVAHVLVVAVSGGASVLLTAAAATT